MPLPSELSPAQLAPLLGIQERAVRYRVERGEFPPNTYIRIGRSKTIKRIKFLTARLIAQGYLLGDARLPERATCGLPALPPLVAEGAA